MTLADFSDIAQVIGSFAVIASLIFVGFQLYQNTMEMRRGEANAAMHQGSAIRQAILSNRDVAELIVNGLSGGSLDPADELRLQSFFGEIAYLMLHVWERTRSGLALKDEFDRTIPLARAALASEPGKAWWRRRRVTYNPAFVSALEAAIPALNTPPSAVAPQEAESAIAPSRDAG